MVLANADGGMAGTQRDVVTRILTFNAGREAERLALKYRAMRANPFAFFRGTAHLFWEDWPTGGTPLNDAPCAWACGDLHLENFGSYRGDNRLAYFDLNDFDDAALAPATWEVARLLTSIHVAARTLRLSGSDATALCRVFLSAYAMALADGKARWVERATATGMVKDLLRSVKQRTRIALLESRTVCDGKRRRLRTDGQRALPVSRADRLHVRECLQTFPDAQREAGFYNVLDIARRVAGTGSLGVQRFVVLVRGHGSPDENVLLDLKEARPSALAPYAPVSQPAWRHEADRVVAVQHRMQAISPALLQVVRMDGRYFIVRELQPTEDRIALAHASGKIKRLHTMLTTIGQLVAWAQLRSSARQGSAGADDLIAFGRSKGWHGDLLRYAQQYGLRVARDWKQFAAAVLP